MTLSNMEYQRSRREYQVTDPHSGEVESFPAGRDGHRQALKRAVFYQNGRLFQLACDLVVQWPALESRVWRAAILVLDESVENTNDGTILARVNGNSPYGHYLVQRAHGLITCDCIDFVDGGAPYVGTTGQRCCKHILAVQLDHRLAEARLGARSLELDDD